MRSAHSSIVRRPAFVTTISAGSSGRPETGAIRPYDPSAARNEWGRDAIATSATPGGVPFNAPRAPTRSSVNPYGTSVATGWISISLHSFESSFSPTGRSGAAAWQLDPQIVAKTPQRLVDRRMAHAGDAGHLAAARSLAALTGDVE